MSNKRRLTRTQERRRIEGLRTLARIIARHYLAHPELYPSPGSDGRLPASTAVLPGTGRLPAGTVNMARKRDTEKVMLRPEAANGRLRQLNMSRNELADRCGLTSGYISQLFSWERKPVALNPAQHPGYPGR